MHHAHGIGARSHGLCLEGLDVGRVAHLVGQHAIEIIFDINIGDGIKRIAAAAGNGFEGQIARVGIVAFARLADLDAVGAAGAVAAKGKAGAHIGFHAIVGQRDRAGLVYFITSLRANSTVLERLQKEDIIPLNKEEKVLLEDAIIENKQCIENCAISREILSSTIDAYGTIISNNLNVIVKFLTAITIVFSVPTMIASFLGMNVPLGIVGESDLSFLIICIISFIVSLILAWWLRKRDML